MHISVIVFCICIALCNGESYRRRDNVANIQYSSSDIVKEVYSGVTDDLTRQQPIIRQKQILGGTNDRTLTQKVQSHLMEMNPEDAVDHAFKIYDFGEAIYKDIKEGNYENTATLITSESVEYIAKESCAYIAEAVFNTGKNSWRNRASAWTCSRVGNKIGHWISGLYFNAGSPEEENGQFAMHS